MDTKDGRRVRGDRSRAQILAQSLKIASIDGLEGLSIGRVATEAGVGKANIQVLFGSKEDLQIATLERASDLYEAMVILPALQESTPMAKLSALVRGWYRFVEKKTLPGGCFLSAVPSEYRARPGRIRDWINGYRLKVRRQMRELLNDAKALGEVRPDLDGDQLIFELLAAESIANVALLMGDTKEFMRARTTSLNCIKSAMPPSKESDAKVKSLRAAKKSKS